MAIASFLMQVTRGAAERVGSQVAGIEGLTIHPSADPDQLVVLAELPSGELQAMERRLRCIEGVLALPTAFLSLEDELEHGGRA